MEPSRSIDGKATGNSQPTRGATNDFETKSVEEGKRGDAGTVVMQRGGFTRELREPELIELTPQEGK